MPKYAIIVIDMLKDFVYGSLRCERALLIVPNIKNLITKARERNIPVIYANDAHVPGVDHEFRLWGPHAIKGSEGAEVIDDIKPTGNDFIIEKRRYSAFFETGLDILLRELGVDTVVLTGIHTNVCVMHTAADAFFRGYNIIVVKDCVQAFTEEDHEWGLRYMERIYGAKLVGVNEFLKLIS